MPHLDRRLWLLLPLLSGCAEVPVRIESRLPPNTARSIVLVVDGAGGYQTASRAITTLNDKLRLPLYVRSYDWTHGYAFGLADVVDRAHARCQGQLLAAEIACYRRTYPGVPISLVAFSAGSAVALTATDSLPPDTLERIILLAPAVSVDYDLRRALASARQGVDVFTSTRDRFWLGLGTTIVGTADGQYEAAAGRVGFSPPVLSPGEEALARRLRQHPWTAAAAWTGNRGGHAESLSAAYLQTHILPLLLSSESEAPLEISRQR